MSATWSGARPSKGHDCFTGSLLVNLLPNAGHGVLQGRVSALLAVLIALGGCATKAQQEVSRIQGIAAANAPVIDACWARAVASPPHQALKGKMGDNSDALTLAMRTNAEKATPTGQL